MKQKKVVGSGMDKAYVGPSVLLYPSTKKNSKGRRFLFSLWCGDFISTFREEDHFILKPGILRHPLGLPRSVSLSVEKLRDRISFVIRVTNTRG